MATLYGVTIGSTDAQTNVFNRQALIQNIISFDGVDDGLKLTKNKLLTGGKLYRVYGC